MTSMKDILTDFQHSGGHQQTPTPDQSFTPPPGYQPPQDPPLFQQPQTILNQDAKLESQPSVLAKIKTPNKAVYQISRENKMILDVVRKIALAGGNPNVLVQGKQGTGKSELVKQYAAKYSTPLATIEIGRLSEASQIFGYMEFKDGETVYCKGLFLEAIQIPGCTIHLQELNRPENDTTLNSIFSILDDTSREIYLDEIGETVSVAPGVTIFASMNEGFEFIGTMPLDLALQNRFHCKILLETLPPDSEISVLVSKLGIAASVASMVVSIANQMRNNSQSPIWVSIRDTINVARFVSMGLHIDLAYKTVLGSSEDVRESMKLSTHLSNQRTGAVSGWEEL